MKNNYLKKRLFYSYAIVGVLNLIIISFFLYVIYSNRKSVTIKRAEDHMTSVRSLSANNLKYALNKLKHDATILSLQLENSTNFTPEDVSIEAILKFQNGNWSLITGKYEKEFSKFHLIPENSLSPLEDDLYGLKIVRNNKTFLWIYNFKIFNEIFKQNSGLGETGEVYLVGLDGKIRSSSRHIKNWQAITLHNKSFQEALVGSSGVHTVKDYRNVEVISSFTPIEFDGLKFILLAEIDTQEITNQLTKILKDLLLLSILLISINFFFSVYFTRSISHRMNQLQAEILNLNFEKEKRSNESAVQILKVQEEEREKISFTLHDSIGQYLTVLRWGLSRLRLKAIDEQEHIDNLTKTCDDIIHEVRAISDDLMPTLIKDFGCCLAIKDYFEKQKKIVPMQINFSYSKELENTHFRREFEINLYRMIQEFFQNTLKHSKASEIKASFHLKKDTIELEYHDNGVGMSSQDPLPTSLNYRAKLFGGEMQRVHYDKGLGFKVSFKLKEIGHGAN